MFIISKEFHFSASHQLDHLPDGHQCARLHGHNYVVIVDLRCADLDANGFVLDYGELDSFADWIKRTVDHRHLNDVRAPKEGTAAEREIQAAKNTTAENLAKWFYESLEQVFGIVAYAVLPHARHFLPKLHLSPNAMPIH